MTNVYFNKGTNQLLIDKDFGTTITLDMPADLDPHDMAYLLHSDAVIAIIDALTKTTKKGTN